MITAYWRNLDWDDWLYGMWVAIVSGSSNSVLAGIGLNLMDPKDFNFQQSKFWGFVGGLFVIGAVKDFFLYINKNPAPRRVTTTNTTAVVAGDGTTLVSTTKTKQTGQVTNGN